jgi:hypothetical protein
MGERGAMMRMRAFVGLLVCVLLAVSLTGVAAAKDKDKDLCKNGGWADVVDADGESFADKKECTVFANDVGTPVLPPPPLAVAYTNLDGVSGFDPAVDLLIAKVVDDNGDGIPSVGDSIITAQYPLDLDAASFGTFAVTSHPVVAVNSWTSGLLFVLSDKFPPAHRFISSSTSEVYSEGSSGAFASFFDYIDSGSEDFIGVVGISPSQPDTPVGLSDQRVVRPEDNAFIDVDILPPPPA